MEPTEPVGTINRAGVWLEAPEANDPLVGYHGYAVLEDVEAQACGSVTDCTGICVNARFWGLQPIDETGADNTLNSHGLYIHEHASAMGKK